MQTPQHDSRDRLRIASAAGALTNLAAKVIRGELTDDRAVAELHAITTDRHLLAHGLAGCLGDPGKWAADAVPLRLAVAAGVDPDEARAIHADMHPPKDWSGGQLGRRDGVG